ncbi:MAG TPA: hypothetical protein VF230_01020 [Acidimicrobiales bacterium]
MRTESLHRGHDADRRSHTSRSDIAATARVYLQDETALTWDEVMSSRGWDRRHRRYRKGRRP